MRRYELGEPGFDNNVARLTREDRRHTLRVTPVLPCQFVESTERHP
jgi:hypothetical protein